MRELHGKREDGVYELVAYHLGWRDEQGRAVAGASGKLLRPCACLIVADGFGAGERDGAALDAACAIELLHAFSLVHDDIEDGDEQRRHRPTLWALHGVPLAINAGDCLFALAYRTLIDASCALAPSRSGSALRIFTDAVLQMIEGQHNDLSFEADASVEFDRYEAMAAGKTGALMGAALATGAIFGGAADRDLASLLAAGREMGLAFQAVDDTLAVWGDARATGKPAKNDLMRGKKSLPVVIAAELALTPDDPRVRERCLAIACEHADTARDLIRSTSMTAEATAQLGALIDFVLERES